MRATARADGDQELPSPESLKRQIWRWEREGLRNERYELLYARVLGAGRALQLYPASDSRSPAQIKLMQAFARIQSGDISEGIQRAQFAYHPLVSEHRTTMVDTLAQMVFNSVPAEARNCADVSEYHELITSKAGMI